MASTAQSLINQLFDTVRTATNDLSESKSSNIALLNAFSTAITTALSKSYFAAFQNLMDDSGLSDQPFWIEGDSWILSLCADLRLDGNVQGIVLSFIHNLEVQIKALTEGGRKVEFLFLSSHSRPYQASPYFMALRAIAMAYIKHGLCITVTEFDRPDSSLMAFYNRRSPLFTFVFAPVFSSEQVVHLEALFNLGKETNDAKLDFPQLQMKLDGFLLFLTSNNQRAARLNEVSSLDGMLQALLLVFQGVADEANLACNPILSKELDDIYYPVSPQSVEINQLTGSNMGKLFDMISTKLYKEANVESHRVATLIAVFATLYGGKDIQLTTPQQQFIVLALFHALFCEKLPLQQRPQPLVEIKKNLEIFSQKDVLTPFFVALRVFSSSLFELQSDAIIAPCALALGDIFDGALLRSLLVETHSGIVAKEIASDDFKKIVEIATSFIKPLSGSAIDLTTKVLETNAEEAVVVEEQLTAELVTQVPEHIIGADGKTVISPAAFAAIQWSDLPVIDTQILKVLLYAIGDNGSVYNNYKDNQHLEVVLKKAEVAKETTTTPTPEVDQEEMDEWDAEPVDDWDAESTEEEKQDVADEWDAEGENNEETTPQTALNPSKPTHPSLLGGPLNLKDQVDLNKPAKHWDTHQLVGDGSTMQAAEKETLFVHNPIVVNRDLKYALRTLLMRYSDRSNPKNPYPMPPEEKIKTLCSVSGPMLTPERAKIWLTVTSQNLTMKLENSRVTKANSTKKEYNQSMITPSRIVLRDIVATEQIGDIPGLVARPEDKIDTKDEKDPKKGHQKVKKGPVKESIQEKVARETQEKQSKADMEKVNSMISTCRQPSLAARINDLDRKLIAHGDLPSALHGLMTLLEWRVKLWQNTVEKGGAAMAASSVSTSSSASAQLEAHMDVAVRLLQLVMDISRRFLHIMTKEQLEKVQAAYALLGFWDSELEVEMRWTNATGKTRHTTQQIADALKKAATESKSTLERRYAVGMSRAQFLMQYSGHTLLRNVKSAKDYRVDGFYPDKWQRELLDIVDANESALVVAPTSAGKTLVSFYTVEHVLRQNKDSNGKMVGMDKRGVVVFVAPTFPLARQMEADISNRNKEATVVIHDTNQKLPNMKFDVLITIPGCLENLMSSPSRLDWVPRIRYIVFDEVHSIGSTLNGPTWERLFLLAHQTPFLALSATVGGVEHFRDWLISMRTKYIQGENGLAKNAPILAQTALTHATQPSPKVHHISTSVRWSHLHHYFYIPTTAFFKEALDEVHASQSSANLTIAAVQPPSTSDGFIPLHPIAALSLNTSTSAMAPDGTINTTQPDDDMKAKLNGIDERALKGLFNFEFSSSDALQTYNTIQLVISKSPRFAAVQAGNNNPTSATNNQDNVNKVKEISTLLEKLNPDNYFGFFVEKIHILEYEHELKHLLLKMYYAVCDTEIAEIIASLSQEIQSILAPLSTATRARRELWKKQFLPLLRSLQQRDWFPAIIFCLDRTLCTELLYEVVEQLQDDEKATWIKENDKRLDVKAREREYEAALKAAKKLRDSRSKGSAEAAKELEEEIRMGLVDPNIMNPDALANLKPYNPNDWNADPPDERFSFLKETEWMSEDVRAYWEVRISRKRGSDPLNGKHPLIRALYRGFGVHHYGVDKQYRDLVEILFRQRNLKFVISIETLGLGVNMPCRTAVFAFTTVALNPLNYRQMSGRAGRRGFDDKGQVIFFGIDPYHAGRLMTSSLTPLRGHYNLSCSTVLRLCLKFFFAKETQHALNQITTTTVTNAKGEKSQLQVTMSQNNGVFDQMSFISNSFFTYSEQFPHHVRIQLLHHFRYCFAYFQYLQLFNQNAPSGLAYLLSAISNTTSSNSTSAKTPSFINDSGAFSFIYLLRNGYIDRLCADFDTNKEQTAAKVMALICHLFFPLRLRSGSTREDYPRGSPVEQGLLPSHVVLPSVEQSVGKEIDVAMKEHDLFVLRLFSRYALAVASTTHAVANSTEMASTNDDQYHTAATMMSKDEFADLQNQSKQIIAESQHLPLSLKTTASQPDLNNSLVQSFSKTAITSSIRTAFHSMSTSKGDTFDDAYDLLTSISKHVDLRASQLPINIDRYSPNPVTLSSYALDFYLNGNYDDLITVHGINKAEAWNSLMCFSKLLQSLKKSLAILSSSADEDNDDDFDEGNQGDDDDDDNDEEDTLTILRKSQLYANNQYLKDHLYVTGETSAQHRTVARCFKFVFKTFFHHFASISRDKSKVG